MPMSRPTPYKVSGRNPMLLMLTGKIKVKGFRALSTFGKLFPSPNADPQRTWPVVTELAPAAI